MNRSHLVLALVLTSAGLSAQNLLILPSSAGREGSTATPMIGSYGEGRIQQVVDGAALCTTRAVLTAIRLRADGQMMNAFAAKRLPALQLSLGPTSATPATMSTTFASNRTAAQTTAFSGALDLPAQGTKDRAFDIVLKLTQPFVYLRSSGNLLLELEHPSGGGVSEYPFDAHLQSTTMGASTTFGYAGLTGQTTEPRLQCEADFQLRPGGNAISVLSAVHKPYTALMFWGLSNENWGAIPLPLPLDALGAKDNALHISPDLFALPLAILQSGNTYYGRQVLPIPSSNDMLGLNLYTQPMLIDAAFNPAGFVLLQGLSMHVRAKANNPMQYVQQRDSASATGFKGNTGESLVVLFEGVFV